MCKVKRALVDVVVVVVVCSKVKCITACCLTHASDQLYLGTESGNIHTVSLPDLKLSEHIIYQDTVMQKSVPGLIYQYLATSIST